MVSFNVSLIINETLLLQRLTNLVTFVRVNSFPNVLEAFVTGSNMKQFEELKDEKLVDDCMWLLEKFLAKSLPRPINMKRTHWMTNKNFLGSYSHFSMDSERTASTPIELSRSLIDDHGELKILFAGEATHKSQVAYSHGALSSGWRAANELIELLKQND